jgi:hypothetical protein
MPNNASRSRSNETSSPADTRPNPPVDRFNDGPVHVSIWEKTGTKGLFRTASFQLRYREGEEWRTSQSYGSSDIEHLEKAAHEARSRIERWHQEQKQDSAPKPRL